MHLSLPRPSAFVRSSSRPDPRPLAKRYPRKQCQQIRLGRLADIGYFSKIAQIYLKFLLGSAKFAALNEILNFIPTPRSLLNFISLPRPVVVQAALLR
jgi:hypothetical protein